MVKSAVLKPIPIAREATAAKVNHGLFSNHRMAKRTSAKADSTKAPNYMRQNS
jgi:hypothetical protein